VQIFIHTLQEFVDSNKVEEVTNEAFIQGMIRYAIKNNFVKVRSLKLNSKRTNNS
jgi:hypothetical protein